MSQVGKMSNMFVLMSFLRKKLGKEFELICRLMLRHSMKFEGFFSLSVNNAKLKTSEWDFGIIV